MLDLPEVDVEVTEETVLIYFRSGGHVSGVWLPKQEAAVLGTRLLEGSRD